MSENPYREGEASPASRIEELEAKLEAARKAREEREAKRAEACKIQKLADELAEEEQKSRDLDLVESMEGQHGAENKAWRRVTTSRGLVIVKRPNIVTFRKFQDKGKSDSASLDQLVRPCLLHPTKPEFDAIVDEEPAVLARAANAVCWLAGVRSDEMGER